MPSVKKVMVTVFGEDQVLLLVDFHIPGVTVNAANYCATLDSPDLAPSDLHLFGSLIKHQVGRNFRTDTEVQETNVKLLHDMGPDFFYAGFDRLAYRWHKCLNNHDILNQNIIRENDSGSDSENENEQNRKSNENLSEESVQLPVHNVCLPNISISDIESFITPFDGDSHQSVEKWIELFEGVVNMFNLSDLHKLVFGKRSLKGKAKLYSQSETSVNSWEKLKDLLLSEFGYSCNSAELQEMLSKCKLKIMSH
ncbi:hypothetical protein AVEN_255936-1 [Araneus ventricosus]|uniref:Uncharacterized protein n=1 Tax=Araneus ventricosus TaxID=182803 RepID=A0A4Y2KKT7_ARAVE|nr:hypothetical protein AVEN_255936-1 [Araneus ventricosus]